MLESIPHPHDLQQSLIQLSISLIDAILLFVVGFSDDSQIRKYDFLHI